MTTKKLTPTEQVVYNHLVSGLNYVETAKKLVVERTTVATHVMNIYRKLGINSQRELMVMHFNKKLKKHNKKHKTEG